MACKYVKGAWVEHPTANWGKGVVLEDTDGPTVCISFEKEGVKTIDLKYVEPRILSVTLAPVAEVERVSSRSRLYINESFLDIYRDIKSKFPLHLVIIQNGYFFEILEDDADYFTSLYGWKIYMRGDASITGFPDEAVSVWNKLRNLKKPFVVVSQLPTKKTGKIERHISEIFDGITGVIFDTNPETAIVPTQVHGNGYEEGRRSPLNHLGGNENCTAGDQGLHLKDCGEHVFLENPVSHRELETASAPLERPSNEDATYAQSHDANRDSFCAIEALLTDIEELCEIGAEEDFLAKGPKLLSEARAVLASAPTDLFSGLSARIGTLEQYLDAAQALVDAIEDSGYLQDKSDVDEVISSLLEFGYLSLDSMLVKRIDCELRALKERRPALPTRAAAQKSVNLARAIAALDTSPHTCNLRECGAKMTIREGGGEFFWGCTRFPDCWGKRSLTKDERDQLPD